METNSTAETRRRAADLYERIFGFPEEGDDSERLQEKFEKLLPKFSGREFPRRVHLLSIGTGYGRIDLPFVHAFVAGVNESNQPPAMVVVHCVEPNPGFRDKLKGVLQQEGHAELGCLKKTNTEAVSCLIGATRCQFRLYGDEWDINEFLDSPQFRGFRFHCVMSFLSIQFAGNLKTLYPSLLGRIVRGGLLIIGDTCSEGAWVSRPPRRSEPRERREGHPHDSALWFNVWHRWHDTLGKAGINRRLRFALPHDSSPLVAGACAIGFGRAAPSCGQDKSSDYTWVRTVRSDDLLEMMELVRSAGWRGVVSSLDVDGPENYSDLVQRECKASCSNGTYIVDKMRQDRDLWNEIQSAKNIQFENGLRFHVLESRLRVYSGWEKHLQKAMATSALRNVLQRQGIQSYVNVLRHPGVDDPHVDAVLLRQIASAVSSQIETESGIFMVVFMATQRPTYSLRACMAGRLIPGSKAHNVSEASFFDGLPFPTGVDRSAAMPRVWLWLYTLYLSLPRPSRTAAVMQEVYDLCPPFDVVLDFDSPLEKDLQVDIRANSVHISMAACHCESLRKAIWDLVTSRVADRLASVATWDVSSAVVDALRGYWGPQRPMIRQMERSSLEPGNRLGTPDIFDITPDRKDFAISESEIEALFGESNHRLVKEAMDTWFANAIPLQQGQSYESDHSPPLGIRGCEQEGKRRELVSVLLQQFGAYSLFLQETELCSVYHVPALWAGSETVWPGWHFFMRRDDLGIYKAEDNPYCHVRLGEYLAPLNQLLYQGIVTPDTGTKKEREAHEGMAHNIRATVDDLRDKLAKIHGEDLVSPDLLADIYDCQYYADVIWGFYALAYYRLCGESNEETVSLKSLWEDLLHLACNIAANELTRRLPSYIGRGNTAVQRAYDNLGDDTSAGLYRWLRKTPTAEVESTKVSRCFMTAAFASLVAQSIRHGFVVWSASPCDSNKTSVTVSEQLITVTNPTKSEGFNPKETHSWSAVETLRNSGVPVEWTAKNQLSMITIGCQQGEDRHERPASPMA